MAIWNQRNLPSVLTSHRASEACSKRESRVQASEAGALEREKLGVEDWLELVT